MTLAAEVPASQPDRRAWISVRPLGDSQYDVVYFEIERQHIDEVIESWDYDEFLLNRQELRVTGEDELERILAQWTNNLESLVEPYFCDYPL